SAITASQTSLQGAVAATGSLCWYCIGKECRMLFPPPLLPLVRVGPLNGMYAKKGAATSARIT
ncbi:MAG TPA: hypothetical protein VJ161_08140, partial [Geobacteraceae bacterium]|nr:hypothetical protein [Geobacteraceae bacterium]